MINIEKKKFEKKELIPFLISLVSIILSLGIFYKTATKTQTRIELGYDFVTTYFNRDDKEYQGFLWNETKNISDSCVFDRCKVDALSLWIHRNLDKIKNLDNDGETDCKDISYAFMLLSRMHNVSSWYCHTKNHSLLLSKIDGEFMIVDPSNNFIFDNIEIGQPILIDYLVCDLSA